MSKETQASKIEFEFAVPKKFKKTDKELEFSIQIKGQGQKIKKRPALNLGIVIDRSGSMSSTLDGQPYHNQTPTYVQPVILPMMPANPAPNPYPHPNPFWPPIVTYGQIQHGVAVGGVALDPAQQAAQAVLNNMQNNVSVALPVFPRNKLEMVVQAVRIAVEQLQPDDLVSLAVFDDKVNVLLEPTYASQKEKILSILNSITTGGSTALFDGWRTGGSEVVKNLDAKKMNRILLFTDGQANVGIQDKDTICDRVKKLAQTGISTSTFGVGRDYNEDLLQAMALAGDGNYYYISRTEQCIDMFQTEFKDMQNLVASQVYLQVEGLEIKDQLNDWEKITGKYKLPNLLLQKPIQGFFLANLPKDTKKILEVTITGVINGKDFVQKNQIKIADLLAQDESEDCEKLKNELMVAREKKKAMEALDLGRVHEAQTILRGASAMYCASANMMAESANLMNLAATATSDSVGVRKAALFQSYTKQYSRDADVQDQTVEDNK